MQESLKIESLSPMETKQVASALVKVLPAGMWVVLEGNLGAGKTTFTQGFGRALGVQRAIKSPTYTIVKEYELMDNRQLVHIDAYRLEQGGADTVDLTLYQSANHTVLIEWAQFIPEALPHHYLQLTFSYQADQMHRVITATLVGQPTAKTQSLLTEWSAQIEQASKESLI